MPKYTAITIGPIFDTLTQARSTRGMWTASYMFSWVMRKILDKVRTTYNKDLEILNAPATENTGKIGAGLFPDRFVARHLTDTNIDLGSTAREVVADLAKKIFDDLNNVKKQRKDEYLKPQSPIKSTFSEDDIKTFLTQYLRLRAVEFESDTKNPVKDADDFLHSAELQGTLPSEQKHNYLQVFFEDVFYNTFIESEFEQNDKGFASTVEIQRSTGCFA
jgi:CRISPR-associated protein Cmr2